MIKNNKMIVISTIIIMATLAICIGLIINHNRGIKHTVKFMVEQAVYKEVKVENGGYVEKPNNPERNGYVFVEWQYNGTTFDFNTSIVNDMVLTSKWAVRDDNNETIVVKFDSDGGTNYSNQIIEKDTKVEKPNDPVKKGYIFKYWAVNDVEFDFNTILENDTTLKAKWEKVNAGGGNATSNNNNSNTSSTPDTSREFTITFDSDGGSSVPSQTVAYGGKVQKPANPEKENYRFVEWISLDNNTYNFDTPVTKDITLKALWHIKSFTVTFNTNGGNYMSPKILPIGEPIERPEDPKREGYTFVEWQLDGVTYDFSEPLTRNIILEAIWSQN